MIKRRNKAEIRTNIISILYVNVFDNVVWGDFSKYILIKNILK
jgi:hypothetical protein